VKVESPSSSSPFQTPLLKQDLVNPTTITNPQVVPLVIPATVVVPPVIVPMVIPWQPETPLRLHRPLHDMPVDAPK
jgi:hypothetical protein